MSAIFSLLLNPKSWPWLMLAAALVWGGIEYVQVQHANATIAGLHDAADKARIEQSDKDAAASLAAVDGLQRQLELLRLAHDQTVRALNNAPKTSTCGPALGDAERAARGLLNGSGGPGTRAP